MSDKNREMALRWLKKAANDIITARQTLLLPEGPTDTVCFHAQQAVEKSLKGLLTSQQVRFAKTHELLHLLDLAFPHFPELEQYRTRLAEVTEYAVDVRYPDEWVEPPRDEAVRALALAEEIATYARGALSETAPE